MYYTTVLITEIYQQKEELPQERRKESRKLQRMEMMGKIQSAAPSPLTMPDPGSNLGHSHGPQFSCYQIVSSFVHLSGRVNLPLTRSNALQVYVNRRRNVQYQSVLVLKA
jgi:hypothetical protein